MKKIVIFHGTGENSDSFWYPWLKCECMRMGWEYELPLFPNAERPVLSKSLEFALNNVFTDEESVLIGHSSGCPTILSYLENLSHRVKKAILVAGFCEPLGKEKNCKEIVQQDYDWLKIKNNCLQFVFINAENDPWGCNDKQGCYMQSKLGGRLIINREGHMGSDSFNQPYRKFPLIIDLLKETK